MISSTAVIAHLVGTNLRLSFVPNSPAENTLFIVDCGTFPLKYKYLETASVAVKSVSFTQYSTFGWILTLSTILMFFVIPVGPKGGA